MRSQIQGFLREAPLVRDDLARSARVARPWRDRRLRRLLLAADALALLAALGVGAAAAAHGGEAPAGLIAAALVVGAPVWFALAHAQDLYHVGARRADHGAADELGAAVRTTTLWIWALLLAAEVAGSGALPVRRAAVIWIVATVALMGLRWGTRFWARGRAWYVENVLVVGRPDEIISTLATIRRHPAYGINVVAAVDLSPGGALAAGPRRIGDTGADVALLPPPADVERLVREYDVQRVIVTSWPTAGDAGSLLIDALAAGKVHLDIVPGWFEVLHTWPELHELEGMPLLRLPYSGLSHSSVALKRVLDVLLSSTALLLLAPVVGAIAVAIKLTSPGPVLYRQRRVGRDDKTFELMKFRTMHADADKHQDEIAHLSLHGGGTADGMFKVRRDPRVTSLGRRLRRSSLDELPQLVNVLRGDMSLVGPRPLIEREDRRVEGRLRSRLALTPGLTGLWQVHGRSEIPFDVMLTLDQLYVSTWSVWGDVKILLRTAGVVTRGRGAY